MTAPPITVAMTATLAHAALVMHTHGIHRLVAIDDSGHPIGVLSASDYVAALADRC
jgi:CBS domain-containing protein